MKCFCWTWTENQINVLSGWLESVQNYIERSRILFCSDAVHDLYMMNARARVRVLQIRLNRRGLTLMVPDRKRILNIWVLMLTEREYKHKHLIKQNLRRIKMWVFNPKMLGNCPFF